MLSNSREKEFDGTWKFFPLRDAVASQKKEDMKKVFVVFFILIAFLGEAQLFPPKAGLAGSTAVHKDSSAIVDWAVTCSVERGYIDISNPALGKVDAGEESFACGKALSNGVISLGDGGSATCTFHFPIRDGAGADFVVFENSFDGNFLEFAFVEVSSDGKNYFRFPAVSLIDTTVQVGTFGNTDCRLVKNLAGTYMAGYGTPFDLAELANPIGLNKNAVTHVRIVDVVGSILPAYCTRDVSGKKINEPWPTPFAQGGFDLDAIGVLHSAGPTGISENKRDYVKFKNPISDQEAPSFSTEKKCEIKISDAAGKQVFIGTADELLSIRLREGIYFVQVNEEENSYKLVVYSSL